MPDFEGYFTEIENVMPNKLGITDSEQLTQREYDIVANKIRQLLQRAPSPTPDILSIFSSFPTTAFLQPTSKPS